MAETDFVPLYGGSDQTLRPSLIPRQGGAGYRTPGFIGRGLAGAQPQTAPQTGATSSSDGMAALRGLYAARSSEDLGVGNAEGAIQSGQQPTREAQSFNDLMASMALGGLSFTGPLGFGAVMNTADQMGRERNLNGPVTFSDVRAAMDPFSSRNSTIGRALGAARQSVFGGGEQGVPGFDPVTGMALGERALGIDRSVTSEPLAPVGGGAGTNGGVPGFDPNTGMAPGERDLGIDRSVTSEALGPQGGGAGTSNSAGDMPGATPGDPTGGMGPDHLRNGGPVGKPGSKPMPRPIVAHTGEYVQRPEAVNKYGPSAMAALNSLRAPASAVKAATSSKKPTPPAKKAPPSSAKKGGAMDALARMKAGR